MLKRKHKNISRKAPENLWLQKSFEFVVPLSLEDSCSRIEALDEGFFSGYKSVYLSSIDQKQIAFHISKSAGKSGEVWAVGYLQSEADQSTRIAGKAGIPPFDILFIPIIVGGIGLIFGLNTLFSSGLAGFCFMTPFIGFIGVIIWASLMWTHAGLIDDLKWLGQRTE
jgi:hypothetical protein